MHTLCFANEELKNIFYASVTPFEARLFVQATTQLRLKPGVYETRYHEVGISGRGACIRMVFRVNRNQLLNIEKITILHHGGLRGIYWSARGLAEQALSKILRKIKSR